MKALKVYLQLESFGVGTQESRSYSDAQPVGCAVRFSDVCDDMSRVRPSDVIGPLRNLVGVI